MKNRFAVIVLILTCSSGLSQVKVPGTLPYYPIGCFQDIEFMKLAVEENCSQLSDEDQDAFNLTLDAVGLPVCSGNWPMGLTLKMFDAVRCQALESAGTACREGVNEAFVDLAGNVIGNSTTRVEPRCDIPCDLASDDETDVGLEQCRVWIVDEFNRAPHDPLSGTSTGGDYLVLNAFTKDLPGTFEWFSRADDGLLRPLGRSSGDPPGTIRMPVPHRVLILSPAALSGDATAIVHVRFTPDDVRKKPCWAQKSLEFKSYLHFLEEAVLDP